MIMATKKTGSDIQLAEPEASYLALLSDSDGKSLTELLNANFGPSGGVQPGDLDRVKVPGAGGTTWTVQTLEGEAQKEEIEGIIIAHSDPRAYYLTSFDESGGEDPPACKSSDGLMGTTLEGTERPCRGCKFDKWGSGKGGTGKACKQRKALLVLEPGALLPLVISAPTGSLKDISSYMTRLTKASLTHSMVVTRLKLEATKNAKNIKYSQVKPSVARRLSIEECAAVDQYRAAFLPSFEAAVDRED